MSKPLPLPSLQRAARIGGLLYVIIILSGFLGEMARESLIVPGDPLATLAHIRASEALWRGFIALNLLHLACSVPLGLILYVVLRPAGPHLALLVLLFNLCAIVLEAGSKLFLVPALFALGDAAYLQAFAPEQLATLAYLGARMHAHGFTISLIFFACECLVLGYLIVRSSFVPKLLGRMMQLAGACYLANSFVLLLAPAWVNVLVLIPCLVAELALASWLLLRGIDVERWQAAQA